MAECPLKLLERLERFAARTAAAQGFANAVAQAAKQAHLLARWVVGASGDKRLTWDTKVELDLRVRYSTDADGKDVVEMTLAGLTLPLSIALSALTPMLEFPGSMLAKLEHDTDEMDKVLSAIDPRNTFYCAPEPRGQSN